MLPQACVRPVLLKPRLVHVASPAFSAAAFSAAAFYVLVGLLRDSEHDAAADAANVLKYLASNDANRLAIMNADGVSPLVEMSRNDDESDYVREIANVALRNLAETDAVREQITMYTNDLDNLHEPEDEPSDVEESEQSESRDNVVEVLGPIDEHARDVIPEGVYLQIANALQQLHDDV